MGRLNRYNGIFATLVLIMVCVLKLPSESTYKSMFFVIDFATYLALVWWLIMIDLWSGLFLLLVLVSVLFLGGDPHYTNYWRVMGMWLLFISVNIKEQDKPIIFNGMCFIALLHLAFMVYQIKYGNPWAVDFKTNKTSFKPLGLSLNTNSASALAAFLSPAILYRGNTKWLWFLLVPITAIFLTKDLVGIASVYVAGIVYLAYFNKKYSVVYAGSGVVAILANMLLLDKHADFLRLSEPLEVFKSYFSSVAIRLEIWKSGLHEHWKTLLYGCGIGKFTAPIPRYNMIEHFAHNEPFHYTIELGVAFIAILAGFMRSISKHAKPIEMTALVAVLSASCAYYVMHDPILAFIAVTWFGLSRVKKNEKVFA